MRENDEIIEDLFDVLGLYHYCVFVPMERLRFSLGYLFYPAVEFLCHRLGGRG